MAFSFGFFAGVLALLGLPVLPPLWLAPCLAAVTLAALVRLRGRGAAAVAGLALGFLYAGAHAYVYLQRRWPPEHADERVIAAVTIDSIPAVQGATCLFDGIVRIEAPLWTGPPLKVRMISRDPQLRFHVGERWRLLLTLMSPRARVNPGAVDMERTLFRDRVHALGTVVSSSINRRIDVGHRPLDAMRERIAAHIDRQVADRDAAALIAALAVGVTGGMSREQWRVFNATGTTHLVAISGLHVTLFAVVAFAVARALWSAWLYRFVLWTRENFAAVVGFVAAAAYATLSGLSVPTLRTLIMLGVWLVVRAAARASAPFQSFALAMLAVLVLDPFAPLAPGFWLSFGAMAAIILVTSTPVMRRSVVREAVAVQVAVTVALIPLTFAAFGSVSVVGPIVNLVAIPAMSWVFVPTILLSLALAPVLPGASDAVLGIAARMHDVAWPWLAAAADLPFALVHASPPVWWYALAAASVGMYLLPLPLSLRMAGIIWVLPLAAAAESRPPERVVDVTILDVGEGTSIVVETAHHTLVYGTGDVYGSGGRMAERVLIPFLRSRGVSEIDTLVEPRVTNAGSPGMTALLAELRVAEAFIGGLGRDAPDAGACRSAGSWVWDGVHFTMLDAAAQIDACALLLESPGGRVLFASEADPGAERVLASLERPDAQVVIVPRHGANSGSSAQFVSAVGAHWAVVSGRGHRQNRALRRWRDGGARVLATSETGAIRFRIAPASGLAGPFLARVQRKRLWRASPRGRATLQTPRLSGMMPATGRSLTLDSSCGKSCEPAGP